MPPTSLHGVPPARLVEVLGLGAIPGRVQAKGPSQSGSTCTYGTPPDALGTPHPQPPGTPPGSPGIPPRDFWDVKPPKKSLPVPGAVLGSARVPKGTEFGRNGSADKSVRALDPHRMPEVSAAMARRLADKSRFLVGERRGRGGSRWLWGRAGGYGVLLAVQSPKGGTGDSGVPVAAQIFNRRGCGDPGALPGAPDP